MKLALVTWAALWAYVGSPLRSFRLRPSFENVSLVPFTDGSPRGIILNILAFVPLGFICARLGWSPRAVILIGSGVSLLTEVLQLFSTRRHPSVTDLILNTVGTLIGMVVASTMHNPEAVNTNQERLHP
jgi:glycopeptide antibiotics resistance protein